MVFDFAWRDGQLLDMRLYLGQECLLTSQKLLESSRTVDFTYRKLNAIASRELITLHSHVYFKRQIVDASCAHTFRREDSFHFSNGDPSLDGFESGYVQWLRDHSSYLTVGGLGSRLASVIGFLFGLLKNLTIIIPILLLASLLVGRFHFSILEHPILFISSFAFVVGTASAIVAEAGVGADVTPLFRLNDIQTRVFWTRFFGWFALAALVGVGIWLVPYMIEILRDSYRDFGYSWRGVFGALGGGITAITVAQRYLPTTESNLIDSQKFRMAFGALGFALLVLTFGFLVDFVVYGNPIDLLPMTIPFATAAETRLHFGVLVFVVAIVAIIFYSRFNRVYWMALTFSAAISILPVVCLYSVADRNSTFGGRIEMMRREIGELTRPLYSVVAKPFVTNGSDQTLGDGLPESLEAPLERLQSQGESLNDFVETQTNESSSEISDKQYRISRWASDYFRMAQQFADGGRELLEADEIDVAQFRQLLARIDRKGLVELAERKLSNDPAWTAVFENHRIKPQSEEAHADDQRSIEERCEHEVICQLIRRKVANEFVANPISQGSGLRTAILEAISDAAIDNRIRTFASVFPNARHELEYAKFVGREDEIKPLTITQRKTVSSLGTIPLFRGGVIDKFFLDEARTAALRGVLDTMSPELFVASELASADWGYENEFIRRCYHYTDAIRELREKPTHYLKAMATDTGPDARGVGYAIKAREVLIDQALLTCCPDTRRLALQALADISIPPVDSSASVDEGLEIYSKRTAGRFEPHELLRIAMAKFATQVGDGDRYLPADQTVVMVGTGRFGDLEGLRTIREKLSQQAFPIKHRLFLVIASLLSMLCFCFVDVNATSIHGFYRDHLAQAFLLRAEGDRVGVEDDLPLTALCEPGSVAPYTLINTAVNLQGSNELRLRDQQCDFFVFSKFYSGGHATQYIETTVLEQAYPELRLSTAMAISAAAVSPNMGRMTKGYIVLMMTLLNVRLGFWVPNPSCLTNDAIGFDRVFDREIREQVIPRWVQLNGTRLANDLPSSQVRPSTRLNLFGLAFSGGGIRSAALNLGIAQSLDACGIFRFADYLSTVSGGGYTGSSIATLMRFPIPNADADGQRLALPVPPASPTSENQTDRQAPSRWRLPIVNFFSEMFSRLSAGSSWVNLSDGGHIENLATMELLRRRCRFIVIGDGECDPEHHFSGVATLLRLAETDLGITIDLDLTDLRLGADGTCQQHFAVGHISYPARGELEAEMGFVLYLKSSLTGDEDEVIRQFKNENKTYPHESTGDQFFAIGQFEAYRTLGLHIMQQAFASTSVSNDVDSFTTLETFFKTLWTNELAVRQRRRDIRNT